MVKVKTKMSLTSKPKTKPHHRKRQAQHHRRGKHYMKAYLPYLPMLGIVAGGALINEVWMVSSGVAAADPTDMSNTRLALITGNHSATLIEVVLMVTFAAFAIFLLAHWYRFHRLLNKGELFVIDHPWFDVSLVFIVTAGVVLTRR
jgi:hypothetical protein